MIDTERPFRRLDTIPLLRPTRRMFHDQRYVVGWPDRGVVKVGSTLNGKQRWGPFLARGGIMLDLACYDHAIDAEVYLQDNISSLYPSAFRFKAEAAPILGSGGAGYLECYRVPASDWGFIQYLAKEA